MKTAILLGFILGLASAVDWNIQTPLDEYVNRPDPNYGYELLDTYVVEGATVYILNMTSQQWFDESLTTMPVWFHYMSIVIPDQRTFDDTALLYITGGNWNDEAPDINDGNVQRSLTFSLNTGAVSAVIRQVPFEPVKFVTDDRIRTEDGIIAYTWKLFIEQNITDPEVILLFPMTKAAKAGVDTMVEFANSIDPTINIDKIMPSGYSKRGWTTWLLAAVDPRVFAAAPVVFDLLNFYENIQHHYQSLGGWSWAFFQYWENDVPKYLHHPRTQIIIDHIDPITYNERLTMPKLVTCATGDQFFLADDAQWFWTDLNEPKYYVIYENDDHSLGNHKDLVWSNYEAFFLSVRNSVPLPEHSWTYGQGVDGGHINLHSPTDPLWVRGWVADTTNRTCEDDDTTLTCRRDFRVTRWAIPTPTEIEWVPAPVLEHGNSNYEMLQPFRTDFGFRTFHMEMSYAAPGSAGELRLSTVVNVSPDYLPYDICVTDEQCQGHLV